MKDCYMGEIVDNHAPEVDLLPGYEMGLGESSRVVSRVITPRRLRKQGRARDLMQEVLRDADAEGITLWLEINPYGEMNYEALEAWYKRLGFQWHDSINLMVRRPRHGQDC